ncbi:hypothetical protein TcasGA2_TC014118 [Tribolium castaneum]|uniref:Uncharacterized protein n=1 Tax=Tribolium castaneum TaxID=7070 RepID=D6WKB3_TRICA|nr:hypothetical protein TcasGA2_TC014118 [Tribolium castaneum]
MQKIWKKSQTLSIYPSKKMSLKRGYNTILMTVKYTVSSQKIPLSLLRDLLDNCWISALIVLGFYKTALLITSKRSPPHEGEKLDEFFTTSLSRPLFDQVKGCKVSHICTKYHRKLFIMPFH